MRGTLLSCDPDVTFSGIIPAHAGNTALDWESQDNSQGSSPRMRGTRSARIPALSYCGIIPAHAGNT